MQLLLLAVLLSGIGTPRVTAVQVTESGEWQITSSVVLAWTASSGATTYNIYRGLVSGGPYGRIATGVSGTTYTDSSVTKGTNCYIVTAVNSTGESVSSGESCGKIP